SRRFTRLVSFAPNLQVACSSTTSKFNGVIPTESIEKRYSLSSGPGGQNVQKNATKTFVLIAFRQNKLSRAATLEALTRKPKVASL
ncbi:hypothetical protein ANCDUO_17253, partial [Ancylostoma duodenale]